MSNGWITADDSRANPASNLAPEGDRGNFTAVVATHNNMEVQGNADGTVKLITNGSAEYTVGQDDHYTGSLIATATSPSGGPIVNRRVTGQDLVMLPEGTNVTADVAVMLGRLVRNSDGSFADAATPAAPATAHAPAPKTPAQEAPKAAEGDISGVTLGADAEAALTSITDTIQTQDAIRAMDEVMQLGEVSENTLARIASQAGVEPTDMAAQINAAHAGFHDTVTAQLENAGVDADAFTAFVQSDPHMREQFMEVTREMVMAKLMGRPQVGLNTLTDIQNGFFAKVDRFMPEATRTALDEAGYGWEDNGNGGLRVKLEGGMSVDFGVAVKQGLIKFAGGA